jgi:hypothetical protein
MNRAKPREEMTTFDITLRGVSAESTISIRVQLHGVKETFRSGPKSRQGAADGLLSVPSSNKKKERSHTQRGASVRSTNRLLPTDKLVLDSLRGRVPYGENETPPVRARELMGECSISRRQVGICLRRLNEKGMIIRVSEDSAPGRGDGYRYRILTPPEA